MFDDDKGQAVGLEDDVAFQTSLEPGSDTEKLPHAEIIDARDGDEVGGSTILKRPGWVGKKFGRFKLLRLLGEGSMGRVILAEDTNLHRVLALKVLRKQIKGMEHEQAVQQFLREARGAAKIDHPNVVGIYEINEHDGWWYIAMELVEGQTLQQIVRAAGPLSPGRACVVMADAATALEVAHEHGIIHRDVKPSNLMITRQGVCKLTDFGLVRLDSTADPFELHDKSVGTPKFMAPEVIRRQPQGPLLDIYGLGATFYFAMVGRAPFVGDKVSHILKQHVESPPPDVREHVPDCPASLAQLIQRMMAKAPDARPTAYEVAALLRSEMLALRGDGSSAGISGASGVHGSGVLQHSSVGVGGSTVNLPDADEPRAPRRWFRGTAFVLTLLAAAAVLWMLLNPPPAPAPLPPTAAQFQLSFPDAPDTYGTLPAAELPAAVDPIANPPASSWRGQFDTAAIKFVASKAGRCYYPIDSPEAALISRNQIVGYKTEDEARSDGKTPAPR